MAKPGKTTKPAPKKWRVVTATDTTDIEADDIDIQDGILILGKSSILAAWSDWRYVTLLVDPPPPEPAA